MQLLCALRIVLLFDLKRHIATAVETRPLSSRASDRAPFSWLALFLCATSIVTLDIQMPTFPVVLKVPSALRIGLMTQLVTISFTPCFFAATKSVAIPGSKKTKKKNIYLFYD
jgi:hypothetical protein